MRHLQKYNWNVWIIQQTTCCVLFVYKGRKETIYPQSVNTCLKLLVPCFTHGLRCNAIFTFLTILVRDDFSEAFFYNWILWWALHCTYCGGRRIERVSLGIRRKNIVIPIVHVLWTSMFRLEWQQTKTAIIVAYMFPFNPKLTLIPPPYSEILFADRIAYLVVS